MGSITVAGTLVGWESVGSPATGLRVQGESLCAVMIIARSTGRVKWGIRAHGRRYAGPRIAVERTMVLATVRNRRQI